MNKTALALCLSLLASPITVHAQVIDGSSDAAFEQSIKEMREKLAPGEQEAFSDALIRMMLDRYPPAVGTDPFTMALLIPQATEAAPRTMNGVTYDEIRTVMDRAAAIKGAAERLHAAAERAKAEAEERRAEAERAAEEERRAQAEGRDPLASAFAGSMADQGGQTSERAAAELACLQEKVTISNLHLEPARYGRTVRVEVTNGLDWAIAGIRMEVIATTPGRSVPWGKDDFSLSIGGGIEPGETRELATTIMTLAGEMPEELDGSGRILDVTDPQERLLVGNVIVMGWPEEPSPMSCLGSEETAGIPAEDQLFDLARLPELIEPCWTPEALPSGAAGMQLNVAFDLVDGKLDADSLRTIGTRGGSPNSADAAFQVARRAIVMCSENGYEAYSGTVQMSFGPDGALALSD